MYRIYFKIAWRSLAKNKGYSFINVGGMAVGMAVAILIGLWIWDEVSYNDSHENKERIASVMQNQTIDGEIVTGGDQALQLGPELKKNYGDLFEYVIMSSGVRNPILSFEDKVFTRSGRYMDAEAPYLLSLRMLHGSPAGLDDPSTILLSESAAKAFFGNVDPVGEVITIDNQADVKVTGVYEDLPANSDFNNLSFISPWELMVKLDKLAERKPEWGHSWFQTFVMLADNVEMQKASIAIKDAKLNNVGHDDKFHSQLFLHPMSKWHLYSEFEGGVSVGGQVKYVWLLATIGIFVLLLACINFMNLSTARSEKRAKEVGIRKVLGSLRSQLIGQFYGESFLVAILAFVVAILLVQLSLPWFNELASKELTILWVNPLFWLLGIAFTSFTALVAGSYPALYLSSFKPIKALKGTFKMGRFAATPRKVLVIIQFTVSVMLIIGTIIVYQQIQLARERPMGYEHTGLITIPIKTGEVHENMEGFRNDLLASGAISELGLSQKTITNNYGTNSGFEWRGKDPNMQDAISTGAISHEFGKTVGWKIKEGRDFSRDYATDSAGFILTESAVKYMGFEDPIGETIRAFERSYTVIGVVEDMVTQSVYEPMKPTIFYINNPAFYRINFISIRINPEASASKAIAAVEEVFKKYNPSTPFEYDFADDDIAAKWAAEERIGNLAGLFAVLAIFISCLGLFGLAAYMAELRIKEIGIRKVLGASERSIVFLLSNDFVKLVLISIVVATPLAWYFMSSWLQDYAYRIELSWWIFASAGLLALFIALATVSFQAIKAAMANPVINLRTE